jgi:rhodanese-related sulfurtransferase
METAGAAAADAPPVVVADRPAEAGVMVPADLAVLLEKGSAPVLLDVRSPEEYAAGHIPGAINVPYDEIPSRLAELAEYRDVDLVVYCRTGRRAKIAESALREAGFSRVADLQGHMVDWTAGRYPISEPRPCC